MSAFKQVVKDRKYRRGFGDTVTWPTSEMGPIKSIYAQLINQLFSFGGWNKGERENIGRSPLLKTVCRRHLRFPTSTIFWLSSDFSCSCCGVLCELSHLADNIASEISCDFSSLLWNLGWSPQEAAQPSSKMVTPNTQGGTAGGHSGYFFGKFLVWFWVFSPGLLIFPEDCLLLSCHLVANVGRKQSSPYWIRVYIICCFPLGNQPRWLQKIFMSTAMFTRLTHEQNSHWAFSKWKLQCSSLWFHDSGPGFAWLAISFQLSSSTGKNV